MTKAIQLRRGTAAEHSNFTGLFGEITVDTTAKTVCVHDGAHAGGHALCRADLTNVDRGAFNAAVDDVVNGDGSPGSGAGNNGGGGTGSGGFDINSVSGEFWNALFLEHNIRSSNFAISEQCAISVTPHLEYLFDITADKFNTMNAVTDNVLVCTALDAGYQVGDVVYAFGIGNRAAPRPIAFTDNNGVHVRQMVNNESFWVSHKTDGTAVTVAASKWKIVFRIWY